MFRSNLTRCPAHSLKSARRAGPRLRLEILEDRAVPATINWDGGPAGLGTNWLDAANWVGDVLPGASDDAVVAAATAGQPTTLTLGGSTAVHSAMVSRTLQCTGGALTIGAATSRFSNLILDGGALTPLDGAYINGGTISGPGPLTNPSGVTYSLYNTLVNAPLVNNGTLILSGYVFFAGAITTAPGSTLRCIFDPTLFYVPGAAGGFTNNGAIEIISSIGHQSAFYVNGSVALTNSSSGVISFLGSSMSEPPFNRPYLSARLINQGTVHVGTSWATWRNKDASANSGTISVDAGSTFQIGDSGYGINVVNTGLMTLGAGSRLDLQQDFLFQSGSVTGNGAIQLSGGKTTAFQSDFSTAFGSFEVGSGCTINGPGSLTNVAGHTMTVSGATVNTAVSNLGTLSIASGVNSVSSSLINAAGAALDVAAGASLAATAAMSVGNAGALSLGVGSTFTATGGLTNTGSLSGSGAITANITGNGSVSPGTSTGVLTVNGSYGDTGPLMIEVNGVTAGTQYDQLKVNGAVTLAGPLNITLGYVPALGDTIQVVNNDGAEPIIGAFASLPEGSLLTLNGQEFYISYVGGTGNDVSLRRGAPSLPQVLGVQVDDGFAQRSRVASLAVRFNSPVSFAGSPAAAFTLTRIGGGPVGSFTATASVETGVTVVTLSGFSGAETRFGSLADGRYILTALANQISTPVGQLDGNGDGTPGDNYTFGDAQGLFRFFGDANGDRRVDIQDFGFFSTTYFKNSSNTGYLHYFDFNNDGRIDIADFGQFSVRYFTTLP